MLLFKTEKKTPITLICWNHIMNNSYLLMNLIRNEKNQILKREQFWLNPEYEIMKTKSI